MEHSTLQEILGVEKQLRAELDAEQVQASRWLEDSRRDIEAAHRAELEAIRQSAIQAEAVGRQAAQDQAADVARAAEAGARSVERRPAEELRNSVRECIEAILPERVRAR
jgi:hypothetical protein